MWPLRNGEQGTRTSLRFSTAGSPVLGDPFIRHREHGVEVGSVPVAFKLRTADGTSVHPIEGCLAGTFKDVVSQPLHHDCAGSSLVLARSAGDLILRVGREFTRRLSWNGSHRCNASGS